MIMEILVNLRRYEYLRISEKNMLGLMDYNMNCIIQAI